MIGEVIGAAQGIAGLFGSIKAKREMDSFEKNRPVYSRPDEVNQYLELAKTGYNSELPGTSQMEQNLQQSTQGMLSKLEDTGNLDAGSIQKLYQSELGAYNNLAMQQAQYHQSQQEQLSRALAESAKYSDQEFEYNVNSPWQRKYQNAINKYQSNRDMMKSGFGTLVNSLSQKEDKLMSMFTGGAASAMTGGAASMSGVNPFQGSAINYQQPPQYSSGYIPSYVDPNIGNGIDQSLIIPNYGR